MKQQYLHKLQSSFALWLDHELLSEGEAFRNTSGRLFPKTDPDFAGETLWASPHRQWVSDSSISGATIPSGVFVNGVFVGRGTSGVSLDYGMGRSFGDFTGQTVSTTYAFKEFNIYSTHSDEAELIFNNKFDLQYRYDRPASGLAFNSLVFPCVYIKILSNTNDPYAFGGIDLSNITIRTIILSDQPWQLDGAMSILGDAQTKYFPLFEETVLPFNVSGDYKDEAYNYDNLCLEHGDDLIFIKKTKPTFFSEVTNLSINKKVYGGFVDFYLQDIRTPRI